jgi:RNA polymerase sigma-70 factor (ECF subfamily)
MVAACVPLPRSKSEEKGIIRRAQKGDPEAFRELYDAHRRRVFNLCLRMVQDWGRAEELTQDTFLQVYRRLDTFRGDSAFTTWLHRIAVNIVLMSLRHNRSRAQEIAGALPSDEDQPSPILERLGRADTQLNGALDRVSLEHAIFHLPEGYRLIFVLHDIEGYEHHEIADLLGCSVGNTKSQLHKARLKIRGYLRGERVGRRRRRGRSSAAPLAAALL